MRRNANLLLCFALLVCCATAARAAPPGVGEMGSVDRLDIAGAKFATPERLKESLASDLEYLLAAEPAAPLDRLLATICSRLEAGYRRIGFAKVVVEARPNLQSRRIVVAVNEGPRFRAGPVRIVGMTHLTPRDLAQWLAMPHPVDRDDARVAWKAADDLVVIDDFGEKPIWVAGEAARFNNWSREQLRRQVYLAFAQHGFFFPKLDVHVVPLESQQVAELVVEVEDEGPPAVGGPVEVVGAQRHSAETIARFLGLAPGQPFDRNRLSAIQARLYESGRFAFSAAIPEMPAERGQPPKLILKLVETPDGPLLGEAPSAEEQALLRLRAWLIEQFHSGKEDLLLTLRDASLGVRTIQTVVSARGVFLRADVSDPSRALSRGVFSKLRSLAGANPPKEDTMHCLAGLEITAEQIAIYSPMRDRLLAILPGEKQLSLRLKLHPDPRQPQRLALSLDPEVTRANAAQPGQPVTVDADLVPAAFMALAHVPDATCKVEQGVLRIKTKNALLEADATTGRLLKATVHDAKHDQEATLSPAPRRLENSIAEMRRIATGDHNDHDPRRPLTAMTAFGICELAHLWRAWEGVALAGDKQGFNTWQGLLAAYFLPDIDKQEVDEQSAHSSADRYFIPAEPLRAGHLPRSDNGLWMAAETLRTCRELFPAESWPCRLACAAVLYYASDDRGAQRELMRLDTASTGPAGHLLAALLAGMIEPTLVNRFATAGLEKLNIADFRRDYSLVLESRDPAVAAALNGLGQLAKLDPAQSQAAISVLPRPLASFLGDYVERQRTLPDAPTDVVLAGLLDDYWTGGLEIQARFLLRWLADASGRATARAKGKTKAR